MSFRKLLAYSLTGLFALLLNSVGIAQTSRGQVRGVVTDQSGSVLPNAKVILANVDTGVVNQKDTDHAGLYVFDFVDPGTYTVTVEAGGFAKHLQQNVVVQSSGDVTVDVVMSTGPVQQEVTVSATPPLIETTSSNVELTFKTVTPSRARMVAVRFAPGT